MTTLSQNPVSASSRVVTRCPFFYGWVVWGVGTLGVMASSPGQSYSTALFVESFIADLGLSRSAISALYGLGTFIAALSLTSIGHLIDRYGSRRAGTTISLLFAVFLVAYWPFVQGPITFLIGVIGIRLLGLGLLPLVSTAAIAQWFWQRRGRVLSLSAVAGALFRTVYAPGIQRLLEVMAWRDLWLALGLIVGAVIPALFWFLVRDRPEDYGLTPDGVLTGTLASAASEDSAAPAHSVPVPAEANRTLREAMRLPVFWAFLAGRLLTAILVTGLVFHQVSLFEGLGYSARTAAGTYGLMSFMMAGLSLGGGVLVDRFRPGVVMALCMLALSITAALATGMTARWMLAFYALGYAVNQGVGTIFDGAVWTNLFGRAHQGEIRGFASAVLVMGTALGPVSFGLCYDALGSYDAVLWAGAALSLVPLVLSLVLDHSAAQA